MELQKLYREPGGIGAVLLYIKEVHRPAGDRID